MNAIQTLKKNSTVSVVLGWSFFAISCISNPILFGAVAFIMGVIVYLTRNKTHGVVLMAMSLAVILKIISVTVSLWHI